MNRRTVGAMDFTVYDLEQKAGRVEPVPIRPHRLHRRRQRRRRPGGASRPADRTARLTPPPPLLSLRGEGVSFGSHVALHELTLDLHRGEELADVRAVLAEIGLADKLMAQAGTLSYRPDAPRRADLYFWETLPRLYGQFLAYSLYRWEIIVRGSTSPSSSSWQPAPSPSPSTPCPAPSAGVYGSTTGLIRRSRSPARPSQASR